MQNELIHTASELFPTLEHWQCFLELSDLRDRIRDTWFIEVTNKIRQHFIKTLPPDWDCEPSDNTQRDTRWFLREFGSDSLGVSYCWHYCLQLKVHNRQKFNAQLISRSLMNESDYRPIYQAFDRIDRRFDGSLELIEHRNFRFETAHDGDFTERDLAWYAAHRASSFFDQAIHRIEKFTKSSEITELLRRLNQTARDESQTIIQ